MFTHPLGAVKCGGAPVKICFLAEDYFRKHGIRDKCKVIFAVAMPRIFAVDRYARTLEAAVERRDIDVQLNHDLIEIRPDSKEAVFQILESDQQTTIKYDMIHVTPKMGPPDFVKNSPLAGEGGWADVDKHTTQHTKYKNVFSLGDCSNLPTSKTGAAIRKQAPATVANILAMIEGHELNGHYDGYTSCPSGHQLQQHGVGRIRLRQESAGVVSVRSIQRAIQHDDAEKARVCRIFIGTACCEEERNGSKGKNGIDVNHGTNQTTPTKEHRQRFGYSRIQIREFRWPPSGLCWPGFEQDWHSWRLVLSWLDLP